MIYFFYLILLCFVLCAGLIFGEIITNKIPNSSFAKWWRKYVVSDDDLEGLD